jgi:signal peptidase I
LNWKSKKDELLKELSGLRRKRELRIVFLLVLVLLGHFILQRSLALILRTEYPLHTPISGSMEPTLKVGDLLVIQGGLSGKDVYANPVDGDIIVFRNPSNPDGIPIVHRAIDKYQIAGTWYIVTKGDNSLTNPHPDDWYPYFPRGGVYDKAGHPESYLIGKVIISVPLLGYFLRLLDETKIYLGGYVITLRMVMIASLIAALIVLEYVGSAEETRETEKGENSREGTTKYE